MGNKELQAVLEMNPERVLCGQYPAVILAVGDGSSVPLLIDYFE